jgi:hypothetical protein
MRAFQWCVIVLTATLSACMEVPPEADPGPDAASPGGEPVGSTTCGALFGSAPDYMLCSENATSCTFASDDPDDQDFLCRALCGAHQCVTGYDTDGLSCEVTSEDGCDAGHQSQICVCAR